MQFSHFTSPKTKSDLSKLGIKVLRKRSREREDSDKRPDRDPSDEEGPLTGAVNLSQTKAFSVLDAQLQSGLERSGASNIEDCIGTEPEVTSQTETHEETEDGLGNQGERISSSISISHAKENHKSGLANSDNLTRNCNSSVSSLVCCDYADSSDASDDLT